jgi:2-amino-4-hydroxy-6-hydroxymethyldihydropteridine diphosphokinase
VHHWPVHTLELAAIGLGANVGPARQTLVHAVAALRALPGATLEGVSRLYRTWPVGPAAQADFWNAAVTLRVPAGRAPEEGAMALLIALKGLEQAFGRQQRERWGPREVDLDLLLFGSHRLRVERDARARSEDPARGDAQWLAVPHPLAAERAFVLAPLAELLPDEEPPGWGLSVTDAWARARAREGEEAVRAVADWDAASASWHDLDAELSGGSGDAP